jgi:PBP1b-binding outer membrane lipoprotein LpoB
MKYITPFLVLTFLLAGCNQKFKQKVEMTESIPGEYSAEKYNSLEVPPHYELTERASVK